MILRTTERACIKLQVTLPHTKQQWWEANYFKICKDTNHKKEAKQTEVASI